MNAEIQDYLTEVKQNFNLKKVLAVLILLLLLFSFLLYNSCESEKTPVTTQKHQDSINVSIDKINQYEAKENAKDAEILNLQNQLHKISVDFQNYKKTPLYKERIKEIIRTVPIDTLASNTIELESCREKSIVKDGLIKSLIDKSKFQELQKVEFKKINYNQNKIIDILKPKTKETFLKMNVGANIGINKELNQLVYGANVSFEGKKGNQTTANYLKIGTQDYILVGKNWKIFDWKR